MDDQALAGKRHTGKAGNAQVRWPEARVAETVAQVSCGLNSFLAA
ncbi:hypothetical protein [Noviherbaspirillum sp. L7-7A]|nr:hypothetical protein [Noviherbaspirillum sp. L7-7A]